MRKIVLILSLMLLASPAARAQEVIVLTPEAPEAAPAPVDWTQQIKTAKKSLYRVTETSHGEDGEIKVGVCTGWSISEKAGFVVTAAHCYGEAMFTDDVRAEVMYYNVVTDMMVLKSPIHKPALQPSKNEVKAGQEILAIGFGEGFEAPLAHVCHVASPDQVVNEIMEGEHFMIADCQYVHGMSGGPVLDSEGRLVSIIQIGSQTNGYGRVLREVIGTVGFFGRSQE